MPAPTTPAPVPAQPTPAAPATRFDSVEVLGTTDEADACDCCGKQNLKSTVALSFDGADPVYYGVVCAARALGRHAKEIRQATQAGGSVNRASKHLPLCTVPDCPEPGEHLIDPDTGEAYCDLHTAALVLMAQRALGLAPRPVSAEGAGR